MRLKTQWIILFLVLPHFCFASPYYGFNLSYTIIGKEPPSLHGYQFMLNYTPERFQFYPLNVYFDGGFSHFWINNRPYYTTVNIYSVAPVVRYYLTQTQSQPYLEISIGLAYLNHTHLDNRKLGIHFAFQDRVGAGILFKDQLSLGLHALHYSNAHLSEHNSGITALVMLDLGYRFK